MIECGCILVISSDDRLPRLVRALASGDRNPVGPVHVAPCHATALALLEHCLPRLIVLDLSLSPEEWAEFASAYHARPGAHAPIVTLGTIGLVGHWVAGDGDQKSFFDPMVALNRASCCAAEVTAPLVAAASSQLAHYTS
ncbi:MAG: hypothetical protein HY329_09360 [Chloroflexi bacterium]|nr:hypothetical protein [Chloroflexota bacterium]